MGINYFKNMFKKKEEQEVANQGTAIWIDSVGSIQTRIFKIFDKKDGKVTISFSDKENYTINDSFIRRKRIVIYQTKEGRIITQNPDKWRDIDLKKYDIKVLRFNLQNFAFQESKAAVHRWTIPPDLIAKLSPLFKILLISISVGVLGWASFKFAALVLEKVLSSRLLPCASILPQIPLPLGITNITSNIPIG